MPSTVPFEELLARPYRRWYRFGFRSPAILWSRNRASQWPFRLRMAWQRARYGFSDNQKWNLHHTLAQLVVEGVTAMREWQHGYPSEFAEPPYGNGEGWEAWDAILARIQHGFQAYLDCDGWFHDNPDGEAVFKDAQALLTEWFGALWD